ncbi:MAG: DUF1549 domain-containing protein, partial [Planctomycetota bacterium]
MSRLVGGGLPGKFTSPVEKAHRMPLQGNQPNGTTVKAALLCAFLIVGFFPTAFVYSQTPDDSAPTTNDSEVLFVRRIEPLLREKCLGCHGSDPNELEGSLDLRSSDGLLAGGDSGSPSILPGKPDSSPLYLAAGRDSDEWSAMPPKEAERLSKEQLKWLKDWIESGAAWPDAERQQQIESRYAQEWSTEDGIPVKTSGGLDQAWTDRRYDPAALWAYQPISKPVVATDKNPIDALINQSSPKGLDVAPRADRRTLIRRATFDLTGLPPTPEEVDKFLNDPAPDPEAFDKIIERLLQSPHYGERMAQHWLDVVRYADSSGFANDFERGNAWRYRDYVIRAFNNDKPYVDFIREQIAGDEKQPTDPEKIIASGFLRMGPWEHTGMSVAKVTRQQFLDDVTDSVGQVFLAHALQCARCHDHKFDPVPTQDYYSMQAVFATTQFAEVNAAWLEEENLDGIEQDRELHLRRLDENKKQLQTVNKSRREAENQWFASHGMNYKSVQEAKKAGVPEDQLPANTDLFSPDIFGRERIARKWDKKLPWETDRYKPIAYTIYSGKSSDRGYSKRLLKPADP